MDISEQIIKIHPILGKHPTQEFEHEYLGFGIHKSKCNVKIWNIDSSRRFILFTDLGIGSSVTNCAEQLIAEIYEAKFSNYDKSLLFWAETYQDYPEESLDLIIPTWNNEKVEDIDWKYLATIKR